MGSISRTAEKCRACPDRDKCNHKYLEACAYIDEPQSSVSHSIQIGSGIGFFTPNINGVVNISMGDSLKEIDKSVNKKRFMYGGSL